MRLDVHVLDGVRYNSLFESFFANMKNFSGMESIRSSAGNPVRGILASSFDALDCSLDDPGAPHFSVSLPPSVPFLVIVHGLLITAVASYVARLYIII
jgi:hypothetical protein